MKAILRLLTLLLTTYVGWAKDGWAADLKPVPAIKYAGILPVYWQGEASPALTHKKGAIDDGFIQVVRESKRFTFVNDSIIADNWANAEGRKKLRDEYEVDAYLNLNVTEQSDVAVFTARLLSPELENFVSETERVPLSWVGAATDEDIRDKLRTLTYRVLNRYPIDVYVTSLQGKYVTLSAGKDQDVLEGDTLEFADFSVKSTHPVDGTWMDFQQKPLGKARVIESKSQSSIAQITSLSGDSTIKVGSGARVPNIASRRKFQPKPANEDAFIAVESNSPLVTPKGQAKPEAKPETPAPKPPVPAPAPQAEAAQPEQEIMHPAAHGGGADDAAKPEGEAAASSGFPLQDVRFSVENENWSVGGATKASSKFPTLLVNRLGASGEMNIDEQYTTKFDAHVQMGQTGKGSYAGLGLGGEYLYKLPALQATVPSLDRILVGLRAEIETLGVTHSSWGGVDALHVAPVVHAQGNYHIVDLVQTIEYDLRAMIIPLSFGHTGIKGDERQLGSGMGLDLQAEALSRSKAESVEWGGLVGYRQENMSLSKGKLNTSDFRLGVLARVKF